MCVEKLMKKVICLSIGVVCSSSLWAQGNQNEDLLLNAWNGSQKIGSSAPGGFSVVNDWSSQFNSGGALIAQSVESDVRRMLSIGNVNVSSTSGSASNIVVDLPAGEIQTSIRNSRRELSVFTTGIGVVESESGRDIDISASNPLIERYRLIPGEGGATLVFDLKVEVSQQSYGQDGKLVIELEAKNPSDLDELAPVNPSLAPKTTLESYQPSVASKPIANQSTNPERITLSLQDVSVRQLLQIFASQRNLNMVISDTVQGNISVELEDVPWQQAFDIVLDSKALASKQEGNVLFVAPKAQIAAEEQAELEARQTKEELAPLSEKVVQLNYASASTIASMLDQFDGDNDGSTSELASSRGFIVADERTNSLIIRDLPENISKIVQTIKTLDRPVKQVMIDARIVIARDDFSKAIGARWGIAGSARPGRVDNVGFAGGGAVGAGNAAGGSTSLSDRIGVSLPAVIDNPAKMGFALLSKNFLLDLELSAMQAEGLGETLSNPRVVTTNNQQAVIKQGNEIPYATVSGNGTSTQFKQAVLELNVTPRITPSGKVFLELKITKDAVGADTPAGPAIDKREINTKVLVDNGNTVVLGGVYEKITSQSVDKVPFLGDLPAVGRLFRRNSSKDQTFELLIFVTPTIL